MENEDVVTAIQQLRLGQEKIGDELNNHLGAIAGQLEKIANDIAINVHKRDRWKGDK
tara:strand:- start:397 stop:567 length:171 start_codon:yes stop_codon:yes gene_type:complete